ncbi:MAG: hypothetical protein R3D81_16555 [Thalassovita sp.]
MDNTVIAGDANWATCATYPLFPVRQNDFADGFFVDLVGGRQRSGPSQMVMPRGALKSAIFSAAKGDQLASVVVLAVLQRHNPVNHFAPFRGERRSQQPVPQPGVWSAFSVSIGYTFSRPK